MHEIGIMTEALRMAVEAAEVAGARRISRVSLRVGALSGAVPEALTFAWEVVRRGTLAETADLAIETVPIAGWCATCQAEFEATDFFSECPRCHNVTGELRRGRELELTFIELN